ncbi:hypothetical protein SLE2022_148690 [Rubroshorea leprosula]
MRERRRERVRGSGNGHQAWKGRTALDREWSQPRGRSRKWRSEVLGRQGNSKHQMDHGEWGYDKGVYKQATAFFFTNFPEDWSYAKMWVTFAKYGRVLAIYSPQRRSKSGNRFGFVRFLDVKWVKELETQLDQIWIEGRKLWVNVAKYPEEKSEKVERRRVSGIATVVQGKTYADAVKRQQVDKPREARGHEFVARANADLEKHHSRRNPKQQESKQTWIEKSKETEWSGFEYNVKVEDYEWLQGCYVGTARSIEIVPTLQEKFYMEGYFTCRLRAMGGKLVLLECEDKEELRDLVQGAPDWLGQWFLEVKPWSPPMVANERFVWMRCQGAPLHAWGPEFFENMAVAWGKFICLDDSTSKKRRFDIARFLISTSIMDSISVKRQIRVNGVIYNLKFTEEEQTNSLFSIKYDFMPNFKSESKNEESWSEVSDYEDEHEVDRQTIAGEEVEAGDTWGLYRKDMGLAVIPSFKEEGEFELEKTSNDVRQSKKADKSSQSQIEEEDSVEVVADSINVDEYLNDAGDREDVGECNSDSNTKTQATTDPIEDSKAIGPELRNKPIREKVGQMHLTTKEIDTAASANGERSNNMQSGIKMRPVSTAEKGATCRQKKSIKRGSTTENSRLFWAGFASDEGGEKEGRGKEEKREKKRKRKRTKLCSSVYQRATLLGRLNQKKKGKAKARPRQLEAQGKKISEFVPCASNPIAGGLVGDSGIENCNRILKKQPSRNIAIDLWNFAKKIGVAAENEENVIKRLEEMESRDKKAKEEENSRKTAKGQKVSCSAQ